MNKNFYVEIDNLKEKYCNLYSSDVEILNNLLDLLILDVNVLESMPKVVISRAIYENDKTGKIEKAQFVIRPTIKFNLNIKDMKTTVVLFESDQFFNALLDNIISWREEYEFYSILEHNLTMLNKKMVDILKDSDFPYMISFSLGEGITDISDKNIELGLAMDKILDIPNMGFFIEDEYWSSRYIEKFLNTLKECNRPYDIVKVKSEITKELGVYNRRSIVNLIRKVVSRSAEHVRVGIGYIDTDEYFAVIEKIAISEYDVFNYNLDEVILIDNENATVAEKKKGLNKIIIRYKLMPFEKQTSALVDKNIKEFYDILKYRKDDRDE